MKKPSKKTRPTKAPKAKASGKSAAKSAAKPNGKDKTVTLAQLNKAIPRLRATKKQSKSNGRSGDKGVHPIAGKPTTVERELPVKLTEAELMKLGDQAAEDQKLHDIKAGVEQRLVKCLIEEDLDKNVLRVTRQDTGEIVEERALTLQERQGELGFGMGMRAQGAHGEQDDLDDEVLEHAYEDEAAL